VLPERIVQVTGVAQDLVVRDLPLRLGPVHVDMLWHLHKDAAPEHRWLQEGVQQAAGVA